MGEGELARVLAAVEALTSQVGAISTAVQQQQQGLEEVRRERAREAEEAAARASEEGREESSERSGAARQPVAPEEGLGPIDHFLTDGPLPIPTTHTNRRQIA